jgi:hypothetical protein
VMVKWSSSRSRRSPASPGSGDSISRSASITLASAYSRVRPWLCTPRTSRIDATIHPSFDSLLDDGQLQRFAHRRHATAARHGIEIRSGTSRRFTTARRAALLTPKLPRAGMRALLSVYCANPAAAIRS